MDKRRSKLRSTHLCKACNSYTNPIIKKQGLFLIEIIIWILALLIVSQTAGFSVLVAVAYSVFRLVSKKMVCPKCGSVDIVLNDTPAAREIIEKRNAVRR